ncbi:MAG: diaminopimelate epimerase [Bacteroidetes bacterium]|nr:MAG: diaminopimelate epimerase [Bacteroidota bacterium]
MNLVFHKYHGTGNDFILIDNRDGTIQLSGDIIARLCDRRFGIGADGMMLMTSRTGYDFGMVYYNSNGHESTLCGNGGRCITAFAHALGIIGNSARFLAVDGEHTSEILKEQGNVTWVRLKMADVPATSCQVPRSEKRKAKSEIISGIRHNRHCERGEAAASGIQINTGSPHLVLFVEDAAAIDVVGEGRKLRNDPQFGPDGTNVDFVEIKGDTLFVRTYERGVENETLSCGTGVTAAALAFASGQWPVGSGQWAVRSPQSAVRSHPTSMSLRAKRSNGIGDPGSGIIVETLGGKLTVYFRLENGTFTDIWLEGPAEFVFEGSINDLISQ